VERPRHGSVGVVNRVVARRLADLHSVR